MKTSSSPVGDITIAFQGDHYAFSELAAKVYFGEQAACLPCQSFEAVFAAVASGSSQYGIIPIENSSTGSIHVNYDLLLRHDAVIVGEVYYKVDHQLIANPGVRLEDIRDIHSHPQALEQCRQFITSLAQVRALPSFDTAGSVRMIRDEKLHHAAAIASRKAAEDYGMQILRQDIQDLSENFTRFLVLAREADPAGSGDKTSIVFAAQNIPGALFKSLSAFALRDIDLCKIESRPWRGRPFEYIFYLDFRGNLETTACRNAIRHLEEMTSFLKILGSYQAGNGLK